MKFTLREQQCFAEISGDYNPIHLDPVIARRTIFGAPVVHGIHLVLWALDQWAINNKYFELETLDVTFHKPVEINEEVFCYVTENNKCVTLELFVNKTVVTTIEFEWHHRIIEKEKPSNYISLKQKCKNLTINEIICNNGTIPLYLDDDRFEMFFPNLSGASRLQITELLATTRLVGMECPGLHSIFSSLNITFNIYSSKSCKGNLINYEVVKTDKRFGFVLMEISAKNMQGKIKAFVRPQPQKQITYSKAKKMVKKNEFANQIALIIGGSRGLGEVTAKLLAAGGAQIAITYCQGEKEANHMVSEFQLDKRCAASIQFDVLSGKLNGLQGPSTLYYFATPFITSNNNFSNELYQKFYNYYVAGFNDVFWQVKAHGLNGVFYPSSIFVEERPDNMIEYTMAKISGETLCDYLQKTTKATIYKPRLPKMSTDQTTGYFNLEKQEAAPIMLEHLRIFNNLIK